MTILASDTFSRANSGSWGTSSGGQTWSAPRGSGTYVITSNEGVNSANGGTFSVARIGSGTSGSMEVLVRLKPADTTSDIGAIARFVDSNNFYYGVFENGNLVIGKDVSGTFTTLTSTAFSYNTSTFYWLRFNLQGTNLRLKVWQDGNSEPAYQLSTTDSSLSSGGYGLGSDAVGSTNFDSLTVTDGGTPHDIAARFRLLAVATKDIASRFRLLAVSTKDIASRFRLQATATKDIAARFRLGTTVLKNIQARFRLLAVATKDVASRLRLQALSTRDTASRFRLQALATKDIAARFRLLVVSTRDVATRFRLLAVRTSDISARFRLLVVAIKDVAGRFRLQATATKDVSSRFRLLVLSMRDIAARFRLQAGATVSRDIACRFLLNAPGVQVIWLTRDGKTVWLTRDGKVTFTSRDDLATWKSRG